MRATLLHLSTKSGACVQDHLVIIGCGNQKNISYLEVYEDLIYMYVLTEHIVIIIGVCLSGAMCFVL